MRGKFRGIIPLKSPEKGLNFDCSVAIIFPDRFGRLDIIAGLVVAKLPALLLHQGANRKLRFLINTISINIFRINFLEEPET